MKWKIIKSGNTRIIKIFLFFPRIINQETRWLENALVKQEYFNDIFNYGWKDICWVD